MSKSHHTDRLSRTALTDRIAGEHVPRLASREEVLDRSVEKIDIFSMFDMWPWSDFKQISTLFVDTSHRLRAKPSPLNLSHWGDAGF